jgi:hypothetical protein
MGQTACSAKDLRRGLGGDLKNAGLNEHQALRPRAPSRHGHPIDAVIAPLVEPRAVVIKAHPVAFVIVHDVEMIGVDLKAPDGHGVINPDVPSGLDGQVSVYGHVADAACCSAV